MFIRSFAIVTLLQLASSALAYGPLGHEIIGAIADKKLAGTVTGEKVRVLLEGMTLQRAANIAEDQGVGRKRRRRLTGLSALSEDAANRATIA